MLNNDTPTSATAPVNPTPAAAQPQPQPPVQPPRFVFPKLTSHGTVAGLTQDWPGSFP